MRSRRSKWMVVWTVLFVISVTDFVLQAITRGEFRLIHVLLTAVF